MPETICRCQDFTGSNTTKRRVNKIRQIDLLPSWELKLFSKFPNVTFPDFMLLQFEPLSSVVAPSFLHELARFKLEIQKLDSHSVEIGGDLEKSSIVKVEGQDQPLPSKLSLARESFTLNTNIGWGNVTGKLQNFNSLNEFKTVDKQKMLQDFGDEIIRKIKEETEFIDLNYLAGFGVISFADLKKYQYYHWFMFPAISPAVPFDCSSLTFASEYEGLDMGKIDLAYQDFVQKRPVCRLFFLVCSSKIYPVSDYFSLSKDSANSIIFGFVDPSASPENPGWILRNYLYLIFTKFDLSNCNVLCYRPARKQTDVDRSLVLTITGRVTGEVSIVGWERSNGKLIPKKTDLRPMMDPLQLANTAVDLNLKLMKWRLAPELDLEKISQTKCLLLGAGTLGCYVARNLLAWGVRNITFVDNGTVSFSNPVRQPLFTFQDCMDGGAPKAAKAAESLLKIFPGVVIIDLMVECNRC